MSTDAKERTTDLGRLVHACDSLAECKHELAAVVAAARGTEDPHEARGISHVARRTHRRLSDTLNIVSGVAASLRENGASPPEPSGGLTLSEEEVWALGVDLWRIAYASMYPMDHEMEGARNCPNAATTLANRLCDHLFERVGIPLGDATNERLSDASHSFGEKAAKMGSDAVERAALEQVES